MMLKEAQWKEGRLHTTLLEPFELLRRSTTQPAMESMEKEGRERFLKFGSPAWIRTTITLRNAESVSYRAFNGLECRIGPEKPALVHNSYTAGIEPDAPSLAPG
jgi:hypothetical protein